MRAGNTRATGMVGPLRRRSSSCSGVSQPAAPDHHEEHTNEVQAAANKTRGDQNAQTVIHRRLLVLGKLLGRGVRGYRPESYS